MAGADRPGQRTLLFPGSGSQMGPVDATSTAGTHAPSPALEQVGPRLKRVRTQRRMTLTGVAETTGISKSTLSRLETGQRRPTLELLLALSQAYRVPLDDLVGAPEEGDPRIRLKPGSVKGRTVIPLTRQPDGMQAWKIVIPTSKVKPRAAHPRRPRVDLRPVRPHATRPRRPGLGARARRGRRVRHPRCRTGSAAPGQEPAEILSIFGRPGERMTVRTTPPPG